MKNRIITLLCIVCLFTGNEVCRAQVQEVISGVVRNESNEPLDGAIISVPDNPEYTERKHHRSITGIHPTIIHHIINKETVD